MTDVNERVLKEQVAWACRIVAMGGQQDLTLGHVSVRVPGKDIVYMKGMGCSLDEVRPDDVVAIDLDGRRLSGDRGVHLEYPLHTEIYRRRPDVGAVIHTHGLGATALGATDAELQILTHDGVLFYKGVPRFTDEPGLIVNAAQAGRVADALGDARAVLLRNHGVLYVGEDVRWAVLAALTLERAVEFQALARSLGSLRPMDPKEAEALFPDKYPDAFVSDYWNYLVRRARRAGVSFDRPDNTAGAGSNIGEGMKSYANVDR